MKCRTIILLRQFAIAFLSTLLLTEVKGVEFSVTPLNAPVSPPPNILFSIGLDHNGANSAAYPTQFDHTVAYDGYFDPYKCYEYYFAGWSLPDHYFNPIYSTSLANQFACNSNGQRAWSGSFMNWLTMTKLDLLRKNLTGGTRTYDKPKMTLLMRSWLDGRGQMLNFPDRSLSADIVLKYTGIATVKPYIIANLSPSRWGEPCRNDCNTHETLGDSFRIIDPDDPTEVGKYPLNNPQTIPPVVVKVCDATVGLESNCTPYFQSNGVQYYKPTGLIQKYGNLARFGVAGYPPFDGPQYRAGGIVLAPLKSTGALSYVGNNTYANNVSPEIDAATGVFIYDPDGLYTQHPKSATVSNPVYIATNMGSSWINSGVINYINLFGYRHGGDTETGWAYPAGATSAELFYESIRYFSLPYENGTKGPTPEYTKHLSNNMAFNQLRGNILAIPSSYQDPIQDKCQRNAVVFIGTVNQDCDSRIPGGTNHAEDNRCVKWSVTPSDPISGLDTAAWINQMGINEGSNYSYEQLVNHYVNMMSCPETDGTGRGCWSNITPNIIGLSYWAHVNDIRPELDGFQSITSYFMDWKSTFGRSEEGNPPYSKDPTQYWLAAKYGGFTYSQGKSQNPNDDPTSWDNGNGVPKTFLRADTSANLQKDLSAVVSATSQMFGTDAAVNNLLDNAALILQSNGRIALSQSLNAQSTQVYQAFYAREASTMWQGNILKGTPTVSSADGSAVTYDMLGQEVNFTTGAAGWLKDHTINGHPRKIITAVRQNATGPAMGAPFLWPNIGGYTQSLLTGGETVERGEKRLNYVRGDRSYEFSTSNPNGFRKRPVTVLGDIVDSAPVFVGPSMSGYSDSDMPVGVPSFNAFAQQMLSRKPMVYVGANDGMLHGFDANTLEEVFAFIPNSVLHKFVNFSSMNYIHDFFVNETPLIAEVPVPGRGWTTELIGFPGTGGTGLFALDVTSPDDNSRNTSLSDAENNASNIFLWELNSTTDKDIGHILNRGQINRQRGSLTLQTGRMANGRWAVVTGNGYNSPNNSTGLLVVYLDVTGGVPQYKKVMISGVTGGLSTPTPVDADMDGKIDFAYAGDLQGNVWRFDLRGPTNSWKAFKLFQATVPNQPNVTQPIMQAPAITYHCKKNGYVVIIGTGKYFEPSDRQVTQKSTLYGLWDNLTDTPVSRSNLVEQNYSITPVVGHTSATTKSFISSTDNPIDWESGKQGWLMNSEERVLVPPYVVDNTVYFNTIYFDTPACGDPHLWPTIFALQACTGQRPVQGIFDVNYDGRVDGSDKLDTGIYASGIAPDSIQRIFDPSVWIYPSMLHCTSVTCPTIQTGFSEVIGINLGNTDPKRVSWKEIDGI